MTVRPPYSPEPRRLEQGIERALADVGAVGILGGTFDPIHCGHLRLALEVKEQLGLEQVKLLPAPNPRLRDAPRVDAGMRLAMLRLAVADVDGLNADPRELAREGETRSVDTIEDLHSQYPSNDLVLILGADAFSRFEQWVRYERILELAGIAVARRPGAEISMAATLRDRCISPNPAQTPARPPRPGEIVICDIPALDISATAIRGLRASGRSVRFLVPDIVHDFMIREALYIHA